MGCCAWKSVFVQAIVICAIGIGAGLLDSTRRPLKHGGRELPPEVPGTNAGTDAKPPSEPAPKIDLRPGDPGWKPTAQADMPKGQITLEQAKKFFDEGSPFVDARRKEDYEAGHIKGAFRINMKSFENGDPPLLAMIARDANVVVYCSGGNCDESEHVAEFMSDSGYKKVYVIHDGYPGWDAMGYPTEKGEGIQ
jgi:rhodanese-related sulfurtransferase